MKATIARVAATAAALLAAAHATALPITYQGQLTENGQPANGQYDMVFQLADGPTPITSLLLDSETINNVEVVDGLFTVVINGFDDAFFSGTDERWIAVRVNGQTLAPRQQVVYTPRAIYAETAREAGTVRVPLQLVGGLVVIEGATTDPDGSGVRGIQASSSGTGAGVYGRTDSGSGSASGVLGEVTDTTPGGFSAGVSGINRGTGASGVGVSGVQFGSGWGVYGFAPDGAGIRARSDDGYGVDASTGLNGTAALRASRPNGPTASLSTRDYAIDARNTVVEGEGTAIYAEGGNTAIHGFAPGDGFGAGLSRTGVLGIAGDSVSGAQTFYGVRGFGVNPVSGGSRTAFGVYGIAQVGNSANSAYGVYGTVPNLSGNSYAGFFAGPVHVAGNLSKSSGSFKIDHPMDPENMYLSHSFVESPEMLNVYSGVAVFDEMGNATVELPTYFEALNDRPRYQLTAIGGAMPSLHVAEKIEGRSFVIGGGLPGKEVSWEVSAVRKDPSALHRPIIVEESKAPQHRGLYLDPAAYGLDASHGIHTQHQPKAN
ncbi:MAG: hypothetical protein AAGG07_05155 [Planctomycetota bacterium]